MTLDDFLKSPLRNRYISYKHLHIYVRKSMRIINGTQFYVIDVANVTNHSKKHLQKGEFREFDSLVKSAAKQYGYDGIYIENVLNEFLSDVFIRWGYSLINHSVIPCFWYPVDSNSRKMGGM